MKPHAITVFAMSLLCVLGQRLVGADSEHDAPPLPTLDENATIDTYLTYAALNNPGLEAAFHNWKAALERVPQAKSLPDPRFSYRYYIEQVETRTGPMRHAFDLSQSFPWLGKLGLAGDVAAQAAKVAHEQYEAAKLELFFVVKHAYYEYYYLSRALAVTRDNVTLVKHLEGVARTRYKAAAGSHPDIMRAQIELGKLEDRLNSLQDLRGPMATRLNAALNRPSDADLPGPTALQPTAISLSDSELQTRLIHNNPRLQALVFEADKQASAGRLARKQYAPDMALGVNYIDIGRYESVGSGVDSGRDAVSVMLSLNIPIWGRKYGAGVREAQLKRQAAIKQKKDSENQLQAQLQMVTFQRRDAERKLDLYGKGLILKAQQSLKVAEQAYRSSGGSFLDLIDTQRSLLEFQLAYERALTDHELSVARIAMLIGAID